MSRGQPCLIVGDLNIEPIGIPCLLKGISAGSWFDLQEAWAHASGTAPGATCKHSFASTGGSRRDFIIGCPVLLLLAGVRFLGIGGSFLTMLFGHLFVF